jgi:hypothetical protein
MNRPAAGRLNAGGCFEKNNVIDDSENSAVPCGDLVVSLRIPAVETAGYFHTSRLPPQHAKTVRAGEPRVREWTHVEPGITNAAVNR